MPQQRSHFRELREEQSLVIFGQQLFQHFAQARQFAGTIPTSRAHGALFALNMLVGTEAGDTYTEAEVRSWMEETGLSNFIRKDTHFGTALIMGRKSGI
jgi:monoamine oxidase